MNIRIGNGFDVHAFADGRALVIGGVVIPNARGLAGHSDADVLLHAVTDALLGALALRDLGAHFPPTSQWKDADSRALLRHAFALVKDRGYAIGNVDATVIAQAPKLSPYVDVMRANVAEDIACDVTQISVKATTTDALGFIGRGEGIASFATVLLVAGD